MDLISLLGKSYVKEILMALNKHGSLHVRGIKRVTGCPGGSLSLRLEELENAGLITSYVKKGGPGLPQRICKITDLGRKSLVVYSICDKLPLLKKNQKIVYHIVSDAPEQHPTTT